MTLRTRLTGATAALLIAMAAPALAQDMGSKISGAFTGAYKGLKEGMIDAYEGGTKGAQGLWNKTTRELDKATGNAPSASTAAATPAPAPMGDDLVLNTQMELNAAGYAAGRPDGINGPRTANAIRAYQANHGLAQDGQPSMALLDHMRARRGAQPAAPAPTAAYTAPAPVQPAPITPPPTAGTTGGAPALPTLPGQAAPATTAPAAAPAAPQATAKPACRPYEIRLTVDGKEQVTRGTACLQADGSWKPVN